MSSKPAGYSQAVGGEHGSRKAAGIRRLFLTFNRSNCAGG
jgi:hypothetical protein